MPKIELYTLIAAILGYLGAIDCLVVGYYTVATLSKLLQFPQPEGLILLGYAAAVVTGFSFVMLVTGSLLLLRNRRRRGAILNFVGGICLTFMYVYFAFFSQPLLLNWLGILGYSLVVPALLSAVVGLIA